jgi:hypothetical protein
MRGLCIMLAVFIFYDNDRLPGNVTQCQKWIPTPIPDKESYCNLKIIIIIIITIIMLLEICICTFIQHILFSCNVINKLATSKLKLQRMLLGILCTALWNIHFPVLLCTFKILSTNAIVIRKHGQHKKLHIHECTSS